MITYSRRWIDPQEQWRCWIDPRLNSVRVADIENYLLRNGWTRVDPDRPLTLVFREPGDAGDPLYQFVPAVEDVPDYRSRLFDLVSALAVIEGRFAAEVIDDILARRPPPANGPSRAASEGTGTVRG
jgi:hypothetical protein